jgi:hypothetical protein
MRIEIWRKGPLGESEVKYEPGNGMQDKITA